MLRGSPRVAGSFFVSTDTSNPIGNMVMATVKVGGNMNTLRTMANNFDVSAILGSGAKLVDLGNRLYDFAIEVASGTRTSSAILDVRETAIRRFERTLQDTEVQA